MKDMRNPYMPGRGDSCGCQGIRPEQAGSKILPAEGQEKTVRVLTEWEEK